MYDIIIIGAGPAGLTAALYASRAGKSVCVYEREVFGGQITYSPKVENYPGIPEVSGNEFAEALVGQVTDLGATVRFGNVESVKRDGDIFTVAVDGESESARAVIIATGSKHRTLGIDRESELVGAGVSYCAVCDGAFFAGRDVCVVGGGNTALQDAIYLAARSKRVYVVHRRTEFRADRALVEKITSADNIEIVTPANIIRLNGEKKLSSVTVRYADGHDRTIDVEGLFVCVGQSPQNAPFSDIVPVSDDGYIALGEELSADEGIFVCGDCRKKALRQLTTAVGDGAAAATAACEYIDRK